MDGSDKHAKIAVSEEQNAVAITQHASVARRWVFGVPTVIGRKKRWQSEWFSQLILSITNGGF